MKRYLVWMLAAVLAAAPVQAASDRQLEAVTIKNGSATLTLPTTTDTMVGRATTDTLTNKSISGSTNTFTNIPLATAVTGTLPGVNGGSAPSLNASQGSPQSVSAAGGITLSSLSYSNAVWVSGTGSGVTVTATPSITNGTNIGQVVRVIGGTNPVGLQDEAGLAGSNLKLNGNASLGPYQTLTLMWDGGDWVEMARQ